MSLLKWYCRPRTEPILVLCLFLSLSKFHRRSKITIACMVKELAQMLSVVSNSNNVKWVQHQKYNIRII